MNERLPGSRLPASTQELGVRRRIEFAGLFAPRHRRSGDSEQCSMLDAKFFRLYLSSKTAASAIPKPNPDYSRSGDSPYIVTHVYVLNLFRRFFCRSAQKTPLPPLADQVVVRSGGREKGVGTFGGHLVEVPPGPVAGELHDHPACALGNRGRHLLYFGLRPKSGRQNTNRTFCRCVQQDASIRPSPVQNFGNNHSNVVFVIQFRRLF